MALQDKTVTLHEVIDALATQWISNAIPFYVHDCTESMHRMEAAADAIEHLSKHFGHPTTVVNFVKAYRKVDYVKAFKEYLDENGEEYDVSDFPTPPAIKITQKDLENT
jgi:hypothetical protein